MEIDWVSSSEADAIVGLGDEWIADRLTDFAMHILGDRSPAVSVELGAKETS